eukprot:6442667-Lingulodinium_polyedra.AAC.1
MAAPAATLCPSTAREPPSSAMRDGVSVPSAPRLPEEPTGIVSSSPAAKGRRGTRARRNPRHSSQREQCQS